MKLCRKKFKRIKNREDDRMFSRSCSSSDDEDSNKSNAMKISEDKPLRTKHDVTSNGYV